MPRFSANLSMLFQELDFTERFGAAARADFKAVEYISPYEYPPELVAKLLEENGLEQALFNMPAGNWAAGERGLAVLADRVAEFRDGVERSIDYARRLGCTKVNCLAGIAPDGAAREDLTALFASNLEFAAERFARHGLTVLIEPINTIVDMPGYFLETSSQAADLIARVGAGNVKLQYDIYHMEIMEGNLAATIADRFPLIAHFQVADVPGRHEPGTGRIDHAPLFRLIDSLGYDGWVGAEYRPRGLTEDGLGWMTSLA